MVINGETPTSVIARDAAPVFPAVSVTVTKIVLAPRSSVRVTAGSSATFQLPSASRQDMSAQFHRYRIARRSTADLSGDDLRDGLLSIIKNIVARHGVNADHGC